MQTVCYVPEMLSARKRCVPKLVRAGSRKPVILFAYSAVTCLVQAERSVTEMAGVSGRLILEIWGEIAFCTAHDVVKRG